jgi:hypothetical protein
MKKYIIQIYMSISIKKGDLPFATIRGARNKKKDGITFYLKKRDFTKRPALLQEPLLTQIQTQIQMRTTEQTALRFQMDLFRLFRRSQTEM